MLSGNVNISGVPEAKLRIQRIKFSVTGKDPQMLEEIQEEVFRSTAKNFEAEGRPRWKQRKTHPGKWPLLAKTGRLLRETLESIKRQWLHRGRDRILQIFSPFYGLFHQYGRGQVIRLYIKIQKSEDKKIRNIITRHISQKS